MAGESTTSAFTVGVPAPWKEETNNSRAYILYLPRELLDQISSYL
jgi:hypothetical protein